MFNKYVLHRLQLVKALGRRQNFETELHSLQTVLIGMADLLNGVVLVFGVDLLSFLEHCTNYKDGVNGHGFVGLTQIPLGFHGQLRQRNSQTTCQIVVFRIH
jgi:hypothetical protein